MLNIFAMMNFKNAMGQSYFDDLGMVLENANFYWINDLIQHAWNCPLWSVLLFLLLIALYKVYYFTEIIMDFKEEVSNKVRITADRKMPPLYPNGWIPILESSAIDVNQVKSVLCFGKELAVVRGSKRQIYVIDSYCPHLGANFAVGGKVYQNECQQDCIKCPFHGWSFRVDDGTCSNVPYEETTPNAKVKVWKCLEVNDIIFVWYHAEHEEPNWFPNEVDNIKNKKWCLRGRTEHYVNCHFQEIPENGADVAHLGAIHTNSFISGSGLEAISGETFFDKFIKHDWVAQWNQCPHPDSHMSTIDITNRNKLFGFALFDVNLKVNQVGPAYVELRFQTKFLGGVQGVLLQLVKPIGPMRNSIIHNIYTENTLAGYIFGKFLIIAEARMLERDIRIWNRKQFLCKPFIAKSEKALVKYRRWFNQFYSKNSCELDW